MRKFIILICVLWLGIIFYMSNNTGTVSHKKSYKVANYLMHIINVDNKNPKITFRKANYLVRKTAHVLEYAILGSLVSGSLFSLNYKGKKALKYIILICISLASIDELHQYFIPGRTSQVTDVFIDSFGALIGITIFYLLYYKIYQVLKIKSISLNIKR